MRDRVPGAKQLVECSLSVKEKLLFIGKRARTRPPHRDREVTWGGLVFWTEGHAF